jgi:hypothetical protein
MARCRPRDLGLPFSAWSLAKLAEYLAATGVVASVSRERVRQILRVGGVSWQATKTWKASTGPDFVPKMRRVLDLYGHPPGDGRVICADEFVPLNLQPRPGRGWRPAGHPARRRATYHRTGGVRHMLAALDLATLRSAMPPARVARDTAALVRSAPDLVPCHRQRLALNRGYQARNQDLEKWNGRSPPHPAHDAPGIAINGERYQGAAEASAP